MRYLVEKHFRIIIPLLILVIFPLIWIVNEVDPLYALFSGLALTFFMYLLLNLKPFWKSLILGLSIILLLINLYMMFMSLIFGLLVSEINLTILFIILVLLLLILGDSLLIIYIFRQSRIVNFNNIHKKQITLCMMFIVTQILYYYTLNLLFKELGRFIS